MRALEQRPELVAQLGALFDQEFDQAKVPAQAAEDILVVITDLLWVGDEVPRCGRSWRRWCCGAGQPFDG